MKLKMNARLVMLVADVGSEVHGWIVLVFFLLGFCGFSEVRNGNECTVSSNVSTSSVFCAAKHDLWQEKEKESVISPFALLHFPASFRSSLEGFGLTWQLLTSGLEMATIRCKDLKKKKKKTGTLQKIRMCIKQNVFFSKVKKKRLHTHTPTLTYICLFLGVFVNTVITWNNLTCFYQSIPNPGPECHPLSAD